MSESNFILGLDLDGVVADFYGTIPPLVAEWLGKSVDDLTEHPTYGLKEWGFNGDGADYRDFHRWAVTERRLFTSLTPVAGAGPALRRLSDKKVRIRIITHRLFISYFHKDAVAQTVDWLDRHAIPYWDLCLMADKTAVAADVYVEDSPGNITKLQDAGCDVVIFENSTNLDVPGTRARTWGEVEEIVSEKQRQANKQQTGASREQLIEQAATE